MLPWQVSVSLWDSSSREQKEVNDVVDSIESNTAAMDKKQIQ